MKLLCLTLFCSVVAASTVGVGRNELDSLDLNDTVKKLFYLNVTVYQDSLGDENYTLLVNLVPVATEDTKLPGQTDGQTDIEKTVQSDDIIVERTSTPPPGGVLGAIESFLKVIPAFPGAAVETITHLAGGVPELLGINVTHIWNTTLVGVRKNPLGTAVTAINNVAFCNPLFAGVNVGRCRGFFMAT